MNNPPTDPIDSITITRDHLIKGAVAMLIAGILIACRDYHSRFPEICDIAGGMALVAAFAWKVPVGAAGTVINAQSVSVAHADTVSNVHPPKGAVVEPPPTVGANPKVIVPSSGKFADKTATKIVAPPPVEKMADF